MTQNRTALTPAQMQNVVAALSGWAWNTLEDLSAGREIIVYPASESGENISGIVRCVLDGNNRPSYLISLTAGLSDKPGVVPAGLLRAINTPDYLGLKTAVQMTLSLSPHNDQLSSVLRDQYRTALDMLAPQWETLIPQAKGGDYDPKVSTLPIPTTAQLKLNMRIAKDRTTGEAIFVEKQVDGVKTGSFVYQCNGIEVLSMTTVFEKGVDASKAPAGPAVASASSKSVLDRLFTRATIAPEQPVANAQPIGRNVAAVTEADVLAAAKAAGQKITLKNVKDAIKAGYTVEDLHAAVENGESILDYAS